MRRSTMGFAAAIAAGAVTLAGCGGSGLPGLFGTTPATTTTPALSACTPTDVPMPASAMVARDVVTVYADTATAARVQGYLYRGDAVRYTAAYICQGTETWYSVVMTVRPLPQGAELGGAAKLGFIPASDLPTAG